MVAASLLCSIKTTVISISYYTQHFDIEGTKIVHYYARFMKAFKQRSDIHWARKIWHFLGVLSILFIYESVPRPVALVTSALVMILFVSLDVARQFNPKLNETLLIFFRPFIREHERNHIAGTSFLLVGVFIIVLLFPRDIVTLALLFLAVADPLASLVGLTMGRDKIVGQKSLQGTMAAFFACTFLAAAFYYSRGLMVERLMIVSILSGLIGAFSELLPVGKLDDNFTFPVVSSSLLYLLLWLFGGL